MLLWFNFINPMVGVAPVATTLRIEIKNYTFGLKNPSDPDPTFFVLRGPSNNRFTFTDQGKDWGGYESMIGHGTGQGKPSTISPLHNYEFHSQNSITIKGLSMDFFGGDLEIEIYDDATDELLQTYTLNFPNSTNPWPVPLAWQQTDLNTGVVTPVLFWNRNPGFTKDDDQPKKDANGKELDAPNYILGSRRTDAKSRNMDVIRGVELKHGDARIVSCMDTIPASMFQPSKGYFEGGNRRVACSLLFSKNISNITRIYEAEFGKHVDVRYHDQIQSAWYRGMLGRPPVPAEVDGTPLTSFREMGWSGDIDAGMLGEPDGPFLNKPDEGFIATENPEGQTGTINPYFRSMKVTVDGTTIKSWDPRENGFFSPTRQMPSAIQFGSIPSGVLSNAPWQTLLFCPNSQAAMVADKNGHKGHPGAESPHDYLYLDLFTMPVVEPYAISEPFSTAGKINLNQRLVPFAHIKRETGLYAVLKNLGMASTESNDQQISAWYKSPTDPGPGASGRWHLFRDVDVGKTIDEIAKVWDSPEGCYRSASQICDVFLITKDMGSNPESYWASHQLTADNVREAPYNYIYPLLTTKSNTYQVHYRVQTLTPLKNKDPYDPANDFVVTGEQRGSYTLERYLDVNDPRFEGASPDVNALTTPLNEFYKFRVLRHTAFTPGS